jgi:hypothetical protein
MRRRLLQVCAGVLVLYLFVLAGFAFAMRQPPDRFSRLMSHVGPVPFMIFPFETMWKDARRGALHLGDRAPGFALPLVDRSATVHLASLRGVRPVVLVFGSYT